MPFWNDLLMSKRKTKLSGKIQTVYKLEFKDLGNVRLHGMDIKYSGLPFPFGPK
jgi:hypothetical protein